MITVATATFLSGGDEIEVSLAVGSGQTLTVAAMKRVAPAPEWVTHSDEVGIRRERVLTAPYYEVLAVEVMDLFDPRGVEGVLSGLGVQMPYNLQWNDHCADAYGRTR